MKKIFAILCLTVALAGCSNTIGNRNMPTSQSAVDAQMSQLVTKPQVREKFGTPNLIFEKNNLEVYEYKQVSGAGRYHWLLPVIGWITSWWQDDYTYTETNLFITFDKNDKVQEWKLLETGGTTN